MIEKLRAIGVSSTAWFESYLLNRKQCVEVDTIFSEPLSISCGVPQGSILGPQLFLIYINDMNISINCKLSLYADDSALLYSHRDATVIGDFLTQELSTCKQWLVDNKLSLHIGKTECILFGTNKRLKGCDFRVTCEGKAIERVFSVKYLGVQLDACLNGSAHIHNVLKTCAARMAFLYRNSNLLSFSCRLTLCSALVQPYIDYCSSSWYSSLSVALQKKLDVLQRKMVRFVLGMDFRQHVSLSELRSLKWLSIPDRVSYFKILHLFKVRNNLAPSYLKVNFRPISEAHSYNTRGRHFNYHVSKDEAMCPSSFSFTAIKLWNSMPSELKNVQQLPVFKRKLKEYSGI